MQFDYFLPFLLLSAATANYLPIQTRVTESDDTSYRLSGLAIPEDYEVHLEFPANIFEQGSTKFSGSALITFRVTETTKEIQIHSPPEYDEITVISTDAGATAVTSEPKYDNKTSILTLTLSDNLVTTETYQLSITFQSALETISMTGAYRSDYKDSDGKDKYMVTTQFEPNHARKAFPCFDEPQYKATFQFEIVYPTGLLALSNTEATSDEVYQDTQNIVKFAKTPVMSTYLIAFAVSDFTCSEGAEIETGVKHGVCSRSAVSADRAFANEWGPKIINSLEDLTGVKYSQSIKKMHQIAIPDFFFGAMENWGLVTYRENGLLFNTAESTISNKKYILTIIAHEFAHQWFGNLVTTKWWNTIFLNEGFATYFEYLAPANIPELESEKWEWTKQFVVDEHQPILVTDAMSSAKALSYQASTTSEIMDKFGSISYNKGGSVLRMVNNFLGDETFKQGINYYLKQMEYKPAEPSNLWESLQQYVTAGSLPDGVTLETVMENWINEPGFPVVTVNATGNNVVLSQKRFMYEASEDVTQWYVPISYTVDTDTNGFEDVSPKTWLIPNNDLTIETVLETSSWFILNNQESAYYRVHYDENLWERIQTALLNDHTKIHELNRAQIVDDAINLARAGYLTYSEVFSILSYLKKETSYYPIYAALTGFNFLTNIYGENSVITTEVNKLQLELLEEVKKLVSFDLSTTSHIDILRNSLVLDRLCKLNQTDYVTQAKSKFDEYKKDQTKKFDNNLKSTVYCTALRQSSDESDWYFLWERFQNVDIPTEQVIILSALGCTKDTNLLKYYLEQSLNATAGIRYQDLSRVWSSVITSNSEGVDVAIQFYIDNYKEIIERYSDSASVLATAAGRATSEEQIKKLEAFVNQEGLSDDVKTIAENAVKTAKANVEWATTKAPELRKHFGISTGGAVRNCGVTISFILTLLTIFLI